MELDALYHRIRKHESKWLGTGAPQDQIRAAEQTLGLTFPTSYRTFLQTLGWGIIGYHEIYGLGKKVPEYLNLVNATHRERHEAEPPMRDDLVPLANDGFGNHYCLETSQLRDGECPVVFWNHELGPDQETEFVSDSFVTWLEKEMDDYEAEADE